MRQVRLGLWETNSSSTHTLTIATEEEFNKWIAGELMFNQWKDKFEKGVELTEQDKKEAESYYNKCKQKYWKEWGCLTQEERDEWCNKYCDDFLKQNRHDLVTYDDYMYSGDLECFEEHYTTPSGDKIVVFGKYGYDG